MIPLRPTRLPLFITVPNALFPDDDAKMFWIHLPKVFLNILLHAQPTAWAHLPSDLRECRSRGNQCLTDTIC